MDFRYSDEQNMLRESVRKGLEKVAIPEQICRPDREQAYSYLLI